MKQETLAMAADQGAGFGKRTRRDEFLDTMNAIVPWAELCAVLDPHYPKRGNGRPPIGLERMLRIHFIRYWFNLADFTCEEALYDSASLRRFAGIDLGCEAVPDATTLLKFRRLLETQTGSAVVERSWPGASGERHEAQERHVQECEPCPCGARARERLPVAQANGRGTPITGEKRAMRPRVRPARAKKWRHKHDLRTTNRRNVANSVPCSVALDRRVSATFFDGSDTSPEGDDATTL
jgi:hypothetical protein